MTFSASPALPMSRGEMTARGWDELDVLLISGDAYVDHPSFGVALLGRALEAAGFRAGLVAQPRWQGPEALDDMRAMGRPRLFAGVTAGALDSMLAHYTAFRKKRHDDAYTPGGRAGARPNRAAIVYTGLVRQAFPGLPVLLGGIEASLRRISHYDFWSNALRRPLLLDSKADLLAFGMGETSLEAVARKALELANGAGGGKAPERGELALACRDIPGLAWAAASAEAETWLAKRGIAPHRLPDHEAMLAEPGLLLKATLDLERLTHQGGQHFIQTCGDRSVVVNPPAPPLAGPELDKLYALPFTRLPHPRYSEPIPAWETVRASITSHRGCGGGCSFCSLALHQGRRVTSRSRESLLAEAGTIAAGPGGAAQVPRWAGAISDVSGPTANMWQAHCALPEGKNCARPSCLHPDICSFFRLDQKRGVRLLREMAALPGVRHVRVAGGVRFDLALRDNEALRAYTAEFTGGQLKVAPEHTEAEVLALMRKPRQERFEEFLAAFARVSGTAGKEQYTVPYLISAFPGCTEAHMRALAAWLRKRNWSPRQVQCFIPTPGTVATAMFHSGLDADGRAIYVARSDAERLKQHRALLGEKAAKAPARGGGRGQEKSTQKKPAGTKPGGRGRKKTAVTQSSETKSGGRG